MEEILKLILDYGLTGAALIVLAYVVLQQMKILQEQGKIMQAFQETLTENTEATRELTAVVSELKKNEDRLLNSTEFCRRHNSIKT
jgi:cell division protein FtsL